MQPEKKKQKMIMPENNPRSNAVGTIPFQDLFGEFNENDANQEEVQQSYKSQGWQPILARRKERLKKLALFDTWSPSPAGSNNMVGGQDSSQGYGSPWSGQGESPMRESVNWDSLTDQEKRRFKKKTRDPEQTENDLVDF